MSKRQQLRIQKELKDVINTPDNRNECGECRSPFPTWASISIGIFLCGRCVLYHRKLGTHISKVKSLSMDSWTQDDVDQIRKMGNKRASKLWNSRRIPFPLDEDDKPALEKWFHEKYVSRKYTDNESLIDEKYSNRRRNDDSYDDYSDSSSRGYDRDNHSREEGRSHKTLSRLSFRRQASGSNGSLSPRSPVSDSGNLDGLFNDDIHDYRNNHAKEYYRSGGNNKASEARSPTFKDRFTNISSRFKPTKMHDNNSSNRNTSPTLDLPELRGKKISEFEFDVYEREAKRFSKKTGVKDLNVIVEALILSHGDNYLAYEIIKKDQKKRRSQRYNQRSSSRGENNNRFSNKAAAELPGEKPSLPKRSDVSKPIANDKDWLDLDSEHLLEGGSDINDAFSKPIDEVFDGTNVSTVSPAATGSVYPVSTGIQQVMMTGNPFQQQNVMMTGNPFQQQQQSQSVMMTGNPFQQQAMLIGGAGFQTPAVQMQQFPMTTGNPFQQSMNTGTNPFQQQQIDQSSESTQHLTLNQLQELRNQQQAQAMNHTGFNSMQQQQTGFQGVLNPAQQQLLQLQQQQAQQQQQQLMQQQMMMQLQNGAPQM